jgi:isoleucyl-tRNA synthetase
MVTYLGVVGKVKGTYNPDEIEKWVTGFWLDEKVYTLVKRKSISQNKKKIFIDGPPYPSSSIPHVGTAWNKVLKDAFLRYWRMSGYNVFDRPGYDCHGLPIEVQVEKSLGINVKKEIESKVGVDRFISLCKDFALKNVEGMTRWFKDLGVFMDWEHPYLTLDNKYIESGWWLLKKADEQGLLDNDYRIVYWCPRCSTTLAEYEVEYKEITDPSIIVKFPLRRDPKTSLLIWTTTPWTLPSNMFVMAHPEAIYVKIKVGEEEYILAKDRLEWVLQQTKINKYEVIEEFPGKKLEGLAYKNPLEDILEIQKRVSKYHLVHMEPEFVTLTEGTGLVHSAPGHGFEDFQAGRRRGLREILSPIDDEGKFTEEVDRYKGIPAREANQIIIEDLKKLGSLLYNGKITHRYPVCWRCKTPVLLRATRQWVLRVTKLKNKLINEAEKVNWIPEWSLSRLRHILDNLQEWVLSRQRYWGTPLPIWVCPNGHRIVIGSKAELEKLSGQKINDLHKPWIDNVTIKCPKCGEPMKRVPDVADVWFDSGIAFYASRGHPEKLDEREIQVDFITEGHDQIRGWFFSQLRSSVIGFKKAPYKSVLVHGFALDEKGREMHKSLGNYVGTDEVIRRAGRDPFRFWVLQNTVWEDLRFSWRGIEETRRDLHIAWNVYVFASSYMSLDNYDPTIHTIERYKDHLQFEDKWLVSRTNRLVKEVTKAMEKHKVHEAVRSLRRFIVEDVSHWYIRLIRPRVWIEENTPEKMSAYAVLYESLKTWLTISSPFIPYFAEKIYQDFIRPSNEKQPPSVHLLEWPSIREDLIDEALETKMDIVRKIYESSAAARMKAGLKQRTPVRKIIVYTDDTEVKKALENTLEMTKRVLNTRSIEIKPRYLEKELYTIQLQPLHNKIGPLFKSRASKVIDYITTNAEKIAGDLEKKGSHKTSIDGEEIIITQEMVKTKKDVRQGYAVSEEKRWTLAIDTRMTEEEKAEGLARDLVRRIQVMRKEMQLPLDANIIVAIKAPLQHIEMLRKKKDYIAGEVRAVELMIGENIEEMKGYKKEWMIDNNKYTIIVKIAQANR